jgi:hypothetical protein
MRERETEWNKVKGYTPPDRFGDGCEDRAVDLYGMKARQKGAGMTHHRTHHLKRTQLQRALYRRYKHHFFLLK